MFIFGIMGTIIGLIPFVIDFPYTTSGEYSGPKNNWELVIYIAYDGWLLLIGIGIIMILIGFLLLNNIRKSTSQFNN